MKQKVNKTIQEIFMINPEDLGPAPAPGDFQGQVLYELRGIRLSFLKIGTILDLLRDFAKRARMGLILAVAGLLLGGLLTVEVHNLYEDFQHFTQSQYDACIQYNASQLNQRSLWEKSMDQSEGQPLLPDQTEMARQIELAQTQALITRAFPPTPCSK